MLRTLPIGYLVLLPPALLLAWSLCRMAALSDRAAGIDAEREQ